MGLPLRPRAFGLSTGPSPSSSRAPSPHLAMRGHGPSCASSDPRRSCSSWRSVLHALVRRVATNRSSPEVPGPYSTSSPRRPRSTAAGLRPPRTRNTAQPAPLRSVFAVPPGHDGLLRPVRRRSGFVHIRGEPTATRTAEPSRRTSSNATAPLLRFHRRHREVGPSSREAGRSGPPRRRWKSPFGTGTGRHDGLPTSSQRAANGRASEDGPRDDTKELARTSRDVSRKRSWGSIALQGNPETPGGPTVIRWCLPFLTFPATDLRTWRWLAPTATPRLQGCDPELRP